MNSVKLKLNPGKTEFIVFGSELTLVYKYLSVGLLVFVIYKITVKKLVKKYND
jgi:hypothetical protein